MTTITTEPGDDETARILAERARTLALPRRESSEEIATELHLVVRVGERHISLPAARARHIRTATPLTQLVETGAALLGLAVVLGDLVPVADLGALLQIQHGRTESELGYFVLVDDAECSVGLLVDDVVGLQPVDPGSITGGVAGSGGGLILGVAPGGMHVLDLDAALNSERTWPPGSAGDRTPTT